MRRIVSLALCLLAGGPLLVRAADSFSQVAAMAAQKEAEERYRRLAADLEAFAQTQEVLIKRQEEFRQRLDKLADEIRTLKEDLSRSSGNQASREELRKYVEKLRELDDKREADKKLILENIRQLAKVPVAPPPEPRPAPRATEASDEPPYVYVVKKNDTLSSILDAYNDHFQKNGLARISVAQVVAANPGLKPNLLVTGTKLRIPVPPKDSR